MAQEFTEYEIPTMEQIEIRAKDMNLVHVDLIDFFNFNSRHGWRSLKGSQIRDWRSLLKTWDQNAIKQGKPVWVDPRIGKRFEQDHGSDPEEEELSPEERQALIDDIHRMQAQIQAEIDAYRPTLLRQAGLIPRE